MLPTGRHRFLGFGHQVVNLDTRPTTAVVGGQEITTLDGASLKISLVVNHQIEDPALFYRSGQELGLRGVGSSFVVSVRVHQLVQIGTRDWVMTRAFNDVFDQRASLAKDIQPLITSAAADFGVKIIALDLLDLVVVGGLRTAIADSLKARIEGEAALTRARNEAATMRSLLNTARLVRQHPGLLELRILSSGQKPRVTFVVGSGDRVDKSGAAAEPVEE